MAITLDLPSELERKLACAAERDGLDAPAFVNRLLERHLAPCPNEADAGENDAAPGVDPTIALFAKWAEEDATDDPEEIARRDAEWEELKRALNESHTSDRNLFRD